MYQRGYAYRMGQAKKKHKTIKDPLGRRLVDEFAQNLRAARTSQHLTQDRLGYMLNTRYSRISDFERSKADPRLSHIAELALALDISPGELVDLCAFHPRDYPLPPDGHARP